jgi:hypothetical protein
MADRGALEMIGVMLGTATLVVTVIGAVVVGDHLTGRLPTDDGGQPMVVLPSPSR